MGVFDRDVENSFDSLFDMNRDGVLDAVEQGFQLDFLMKDMESYSSDNDEDDLDMDPLLDRDELEMMDEDERREALEDAGYGPDDFDEF